MKVNYLALLLLFALPTVPLSAQQTIEINHNNLRAYMSSNGALTNPDDIHWLTYNTEEGYAPLVHFTGLWMGGIDPGGNLFIADLRDGGLPGPVDASTPLDKVWSVTSDQVANHLADFEEDGMIDSPIPEVYAWPGRGNPFFSDYNEGLELPTGNISQSVLAPFWDSDGDGLYNPANGDYPILEARGCGSSIVVPSQMNWCIFTVVNDTNGADMYDVSLNLFTFDCEEEHPLNDVIFTSYKIVNIALEPYDNMYWGLFTDADLGCPFDDYTGTFPERFVSYTYNADNEDENCFGDLVTFGENPPAFAVDVYRGPYSPMTDTIISLPSSSIMSFSNPSVGNPAPGTTDPGNIIEYYNYLQGLWRDGSPLTVGEDGYGGNEVTDFAFPGLPEETDAWTEWQASNSSGDRRSLINFGPFESLPGAVDEFIASYSIHTGNGDHLDNVASLRDRTDIYQAYYDSCFEVENTVGLPACTLVLSNTEAPTIQAMEINVFPNPATDRITITSRHTIERTWLMDLTGQLIREHLGTDIDVSQLSSGMYIIGMEIEGQQVHKKIIVE
jgi:hypothetical protein